MDLTEFADQVVRIHLPAEPSQLDLSPDGTGLGLIKRHPQANFVGSLERVQGQVLGKGIDRLHNCLVVLVPEEPLADRNH